MLAPLKSKALHFATKLLKVSLVAALTFVNI